MKAHYKPHYRLIKFYNEYSIYEGHNYIISRANLTAMRHLRYHMEVEFILREIHHMYISPLIQREIKTLSFYYGYRISNLDKVIESILA